MLKNTCEWDDANHSMHKCFISYSDPLTLKSETKWFKVDDVTSVTKEENYFAAFLGSGNTLLQRK